MPQSKIQWGAEEYISPRAYIGSRPPSRFDASKARLDPLIKKGDEEFGTWRKVGGICKSAAIVTGTTGLNKAVGTAFGLLGVQGISMIVSAGIATVKGASTGFDIEALGNTFEENKSRCICDHCGAVYDYVFDQLQLKSAKRYVGALPGISTLSTVGFALRGAYKRAVGTKGVERHKYACMLWVCAKDGCPCAKALISQLFDWDVSAFVTIVTSYMGIKLVALKIQSS